MNVFNWYVVLNSFFYITLLCWSYKSKKRFTVGTFIISIWTVSSVCAIFYEQFNLFGHLKDITLIPYLYLFVCFFFMVWPFILFDESKISFIKVSPQKVRLLAFFIGLIALLPFLESLLFYMHNYNQQDILLDNFNERYEDTSLTYKYLSNISRKLNYISHSLRPVSLFLILYYPVIIKSKIDKLLYTGVIVSVLLIILESQIVVARFQIIFNLLLFVYIYLNIRFVYSAEFQIKIKKYLKYGAIVVVGVLIFQSSLRLFNFVEKFDVGGVSQTVYTAQYLSESMGNFNGNMFYSDARTGADPVLKYYADLFGIDLSFLKHGSEDRFYTNLFFTVVGDFWRSYGPVATFLLFLLVPFIGFQILRWRFDGHLTFAKLMFMILFARIPLMGIFYNSYYIETDQLIMLPLLMILI